MQLTVNVRVVTTRLNKKGEVPIYYRLTMDGQRAELASGYHVMPNDWDSQAQRVKATVHGSDSINQCIEADRARLLSIYSQYHISGIPFTVSDLRQKLDGKQAKAHTLQEVIIQFLSNFKSQIGTEGYSTGRYKRYVVFQGKISRFLQGSFKSKDIDLARIRQSFIVEFELFLKVQEKLDTGTVAIYLKILKRIIRYAISKEWLSHDPFISFKCKSKRVDRAYLNEADLKAIESKEFISERLAVVRDLFVFSCYTGLAYSDVHKLTRDNLEVGCNGGMLINISRTKTGEPCKIPLLPVAKAIIEKYKNNPECAYKGKLLPVRANQKMNEYLKEIADICGIRKHITFHSARHTFATTVLLNNGMSLEAVSKLLGHRNIRTTQLYARITHQRLSHEMTLLSERLNSKT